MQELPDIFPEEEDWKDEWYEEPEPEKERERERQHDRTERPS